MTRMTAVFIALCALGLSVILSPAAHAEGPKPEQFGDWAVHCPQAESGEQGLCRMIQVAERVDDTSGQSIPILVTSLALLPAQEGANVTGMSLLVPLGVYLYSGIAVQIDEKEGFAVPYTACRPEGCQAQFPVSEELLAEMKAGSKARIIAIDGTGQRFEVPVSLSGFTAAWNRIGALAPAG